MISQKRAVESARVISDYCKEQRSCQNCIFRKFGADHWECHIESFEIKAVLANIEAKKKKRGYL